MERGELKWTFHYHERGTPVPEGWTVIGPAPGHHAERFDIIERITQPGASE